MTFKNLALFTALALFYTFFHHLTRYIGTERRIGKGVVVDRLYVPSQFALNLGTPITGDAEIGGYVGSAMSSDKWYILVEVDEWRTFPVIVDPWDWTKYKVGSECEVVEHRSLFAWQYKVAE